MSNMRAQTILVVLVLKICFASVLAIDVLPQSEMRELDIFLQDEEYKQISRMKRTHEDNQNGVENSGDGPPEVADLFSGNEDIFQNPQGNSTDMVDSPNLSNSTAAQNAPESINVKIPILAVNASNTATEAETPPESLDISVSASNDSLPLEPISANIPISSLQNISNVHGPPIINLVQPRDDDDVTPPVTEAEGTTLEVEVTEAATTEKLEITTPMISLAKSVAASAPRAIPTNNQTDVSVNDTDVNNTDIAATTVAPDLSPINSTTDVNITAVYAPSSVNVTEDVEAPSNNKTNVVEIPTAGNNTSTNSTTNVAKSADPGNNVSINNATNVAKSTDPEISKNSTVVTTAPTAKPASVETDTTTKQSGVSGSGVLFTIIALVLIAGLAAGGYYIYKKRRSGYDPVEVEDQDKELMEIKSENGGFGKPIKDEEVKLDDQLTPTQPMAAPRTFAVTPTIEKKYDEALAKENENDDADETSKKMEH